MSEPSAAKGRPDPVTMDKDIPPEGPVSSKVEAKSAEQQSLLAAESEVAELKES